MGLIATRHGQSELPIASAEIQDEVELYARESGRHAKIHFVPTDIDFKTGKVWAGTWRVDLTLHPEDPRMRTYQEGRMDKPPVEEIWIHDKNPKPDGWQDKYIPRNIQQMGPSGVRQFLEQGNVHSGRGEFSSLEDSIRKTTELNEAKSQQRRAEAEDRVRINSKEKRRSRLNIPFLTVKTDLRKPTTRSMEK